MKNSEEQTILLIEDNSGDSRLIKEMLKEITSFHYQPVVAETLKDGCRLIKKHNFILVLLDLNLPDSTGKQTFDTVIKVAGNLPVVLVSGRQDEELSLSLIKEGAQDYILKQDLNSTLLGKTIQYAVIRKQMEVALRESENRVRTKLNAILLPEGNLDELVIEDILDVPAVHGIMENIFKLTGIAVALGDLNGKALVAFGWQDVCTQYHRSHPEACKNCTESDTVLSSLVKPGTFKVYKCKNNLWDLAAPIHVGGRHVGNLFVGQFFYFDEVPDLAAFKAQAKQYGFNEAAYLSALDRVPRVSTETVNALAGFYTQFSALISNLSYSSIRFARMLNERDLAEVALLQNKAIKHKMVSNIGDVIVIIDQNGINQYKSPNIEKLFGWKPEDLVGESTWNTVHPADLESARKFLGAIALEPGASGTTEIRYRCKNGKYVWIEITLVNLLSDPDIKGLLGNYHDITARKQYEHDIIIAKEHAEESDRLKSTFLANMSHEIRTPMNGILGFAELLKDSHLSGEDQQQYINIINKSGHRMLNIINDIVDISIIESGQMEISLKETNINEQTKYIHTFFEPEAANKGLQFFVKNTLPVPEAIIKTDCEKLYAILVNLVKNAIKFTSTGSIEFGYEKKGDFLEFFVIDTGGGISQDQKEIIFTRFRQGNDLITRPYEGTGLGLSISKAYIEMLGGKIWVVSDLGKGSKFYFTLPYNVEKAVKPIIKDGFSVTTADNQSKALKILVVENDEDSQSLIMTVLKTFGKEFLRAGTGVEAVNAIRNHHDIDLILMDIRMPIMDGYEATRQIRQFNKDVVIIAQTAFGLAGDRENAIKAGCNDYISKPIKIDLLKGLIQKYFSK